MLRNRALQINIYLRTHPTKCLSVVTVAVVLVVDSIRFSSNSSQSVAITVSAMAQCPQTL